MRVVSTTTAGRYTRSSHDTLETARTYPSCSAAANEAGRSRVGGGIHFEFSSQGTPYAA